MERQDIDDTRTDMVVFFVLVGLAICQMLYYSPKLPDTMPYHFDMSMQPDAWGTKEFFFLMYLSVIALLVACFVPFRLFIHKIPVSLMSMPGKEYWMSEERKAHTCSVLGRWTMWFGCLTLGLVLAVMEVVIRCSLDQSSVPLSSIWVIIGIYILMTIIYTASLLVRFMKTPAQ